MGQSFVVAVLALNGPIDGVLTELAPALETTAYELRLALSAGLPAVVLITSDPDRARLAAKAIERSGQRAATCLRSAIAPSSALTALRDFQHDHSALIANNGAERLPFADISALVRASLRTTQVSTKEVKERKLRPGMAIVTAGLVASKTTTREVTTRSDDREQVLYLFRRSPSPPWILREHSARYGGLGIDLGRTTLENFGAAVLRLRQLAPDASYDERLLSARSVRGIADPVEVVDLLAHLLAMGLATR